MTPFMRHDMGAANCWHYLCAALVLERSFLETMAGRQTPTEDTVLLLCAFLPENIAPLASA